MPKTKLCPLVGRDPLNLYHPKVNSSGTWHCILWRQRASLSLRCCSGGTNQRRRSLPNVYSLPWDVLIYIPYMRALIVFLVSKCLSRCLDRKLSELSAMTAAYWNRNCGTKNWKILSPLEEPLGDPNLKTPHPEIQDELPPELRNFGSNMGVSENRGTPKSSHFNWVFHYFHHPFWRVFPLFLDFHPYITDFYYLPFCCWVSRNFFAWLRGFAPQAPRHGSRPAALEAIIATWHEDSLIQHS